MREYDVELLLEYAIADGYDPSRSMTRAETLAYDPRTGWGGGRVIRPKDVPLHGFWRQVAQAVHAGFDSQESLAGALSLPQVRIARAVLPMIRRGLLHQDGARLTVTKRTKRQLVAGARH